MADVVYITVGLGFFGVCLAMCRLCESLLRG